MSGGWQAGASPKELTQGGGVTESLGTAGLVEDSCII